MKNTALKFGLYSGITLIALFIISHFCFPDSSFTTQEVVGYLSMFIALSFVFFGIKSHRDSLPDQKISFGKALGIGMLIVLIPSLFFGIFNAIYMVYIAPDFVEAYYAEAIAEITKEYSGAELTEKITEMENMKSMASSVTFSSLLMGFTVFILGFIVSLISAVSLRRS